MEKIIDSLIGNENNRYHFKIHTEYKYLHLGTRTIPSTDTSTSLCQKTLINSQLEGVSDTRQAGESRIRGGAPRKAQGRRWLAAAVLQRSPPGPRRTVDKGLPAPGATVDRVVF